VRAWRCQQQHGVEDLNLTNKTSKQTNNLLEEIEEWSQVSPKWSLSVRLAVELPDENGYILGDEALNHLGNSHLG
jgi:hypothetical protein